MITTTEMRHADLTVADLVRSCASYQEVLPDHLVACLPDQGA